MSEPFCFIMTRHVNSPQTNLLWIESYHCVRKLYPKEPIIIIDDNSNYEFITHISTSNCRVIQSEFPGRGELLPYYYFYHLNFEKAVMIHDSLFLQQKIDFESVQDAKLLFSFPSPLCIENSADFLRYLHHWQPVAAWYRNFHLWSGCFGVMTIMTKDCINYIQNKYNFFNLLHHVRTRSDRMCMERVLPMLLYYENKIPQNEPAIFGDIFQYNSNQGLIPLGCVTFSTYLENFKPPEDVTQQVLQHGSPLNVSNSLLGDPFPNVYKKLFYTENGEIQNIVDENNTFHRYYSPNARFYYGPNYFITPMNVTQIVLQNYTDQNGNVSITRNKNHIFGDPFPNKQKRLYVVQNGIILKSVDEEINLFINVDKNSNVLFLYGPSHYAVVKVWTGR